jgi:hypothetical protein
VREQQVLRLWEVGISYHTLTAYLRFRPGVDVETEPAQPE